MKNSKRTFLYAFICLVVFVVIIWMLKELIHPAISIALVFLFIICFFIMEWMNKIFFEPIMKFFKPFLQHYPSPAIEKIIEKSFLIGTAILIVSFNIPDLFSVIANFPKPVKLVPELNSLCFYVGILFFIIPGLSIFFYLFIQELYKHFEELNKSYTKNKKR